jgi:hypothetical protein
LPARTYIGEGALTFGAANALASGAVGGLLGLLTLGPLGAIGLGTGFAIGGGISGAISGALTGAAVAATHPRTATDIAKRAGLVAGGLGVATSLLTSRGSFPLRAVNAVTSGAVNYMIGRWMGRRLAEKAAHH